MTEEEKQSFEAEKAQIAADHEARLREVEEKHNKERENLNKALHEARTKKPEAAKEEKKEEIDLSKVEEVTRKTASQVIHEREIDLLVNSAGDSEDERKLIKAHFDRLKGSETDISKLREFVEDAKILANKASLIKRNPSMAVGSASGGRGVETQSEDDSSAKALGKNFGLTDEDYAIVNKPIIH
jgi:NAD(P)-dependent dehydrogenase (short-subunit alcohol dehydrogenase family)